VVSFRGRFSDQARQGERITARGTVERVTPVSGDDTTRLTVGGSPGDFLAADSA
jgi:predicted nucleotidyltransferase